MGRPVYSHEILTKRLIIFCFYFQAIEDIITIESVYWTSKLAITDVVINSTYLSYKYR